MLLSLSVRPRRLRQSAQLRQLVCQSALGIDDLIYYLIVEDTGVAVPLP